MNKRFKPEVRKEQIIDAARHIVAKAGFAALSRQAIAERVGVSGQTINHYFGTLKQLERAVKRAAVNDRDLKIIGQLIVTNDATVKGLDTQTRAEALRAFK